MKHSEYLALCKEIWEHNKRYYVEHKPTISDEQWDHLMHKLLEAERAHPEWVEATSPSQRVNESLTKGFKTVTHRVPMLSLANTYSQEELSDFVERVHRLLGHKRVLFTVELKMDGLAVTVVYREGKLLYGATRGDGKQGDDVTVNLKTIKTLPLQLVGKEIPEEVEVRGEVHLSHKQFAKMNREREEAGEELWANPRNAAAGTLKLLDPKEVKKRQLSIAFYTVLGTDAVKEQKEVPHFLQEHGLPTLDFTATATTLEEIWEHAETVRRMRDKLEYDIDGVVVKVSDFSLQQKLGVAGKNPRWAVAFKFAAEQAKTKILEITVQVGRTGVLTPVAELEPVFLAGSTIARATLHNADEVERKDIRVGDTVVIEKGGDVIPKVVSVDLKQRSVHSRVWHMPKTCPSCGAQVVRGEDEVAVRCPNHKGCPEQQLGRLRYFVSKAAMDIDHMGEKVVEQLVNKGFVKRPSDIYCLTRAQIEQLDGFKEKSVENLLRSIEASRHVSLERFIMALGIKHVGAGTAELLANKTGSVEKFLALTKEQLESIEGIGEVVAEAILEHLQDAQHLKEIEELLKAGVQPERVKVKHFHGHPFEGKSFVLTGTLHRYTRPDVAKMIKERGGKVVGSVSKNTDYLVVGEEAGSKLDKARELGVKTLTEEAFLKMLGE